MNHHPKFSTYYPTRNKTEVTLTVPLNGESEKIAEQLQQLPPEAVQILTQAIAIWIGKNKSP
jgi:rubrerythrin